MALNLRADLGHSCGTAGQHDGGRVDQRKRGRLAIDPQPGLSEGRRSGADIAEMLHRLLGPMKGEKARIRIGIAKTAYAICPARCSAIVFPYKVGWAVHSPVLMYSGHPAPPRNRHQYAVDGQTRNNCLEHALLWTDLRGR